MNSNNSDPVSKRLKLKVNSADRELTNKTDDDSTGSVLIVSGSEVTMAKEDAKSFVSIFTDDILPEILDNLSTLTVEDLLNFRLVNRCWRDAATSVLLKRNLCEISLDFGRVNLPEKKGPPVSQVETILNLQIGVKNSSQSAYKYFNVYQSGSSLSDLNHLLSTTHRFPTTSLRLHRDIWSVLKDVPRPYSCVNVDQNQLELLHFMSLYGKKIKKITICDEIDIKTFEDFVNVHMPNLISLDIREFNFINSEQSEIPISPRLSPSALLLLNEIVLPGEDHRRFEEDLIRASPNLNCIRRVDLSSLEILLQVGKSHCIKDLYLRPTANQMSTIQEFSKLLTDTINRKDNVSQLKLSSLTLDFTYVGNSQDQWDVVLKAIHLILSTSTATLKCLDIQMHPSEFLVLFIPPLPYLQILELVDNTPVPTIPSDNESSSFKTNFFFVGDVIGDAVRAGKITANQSAHDFSALLLHSQGSRYCRSHNIPVDYFPCLSNVQIYKYGAKERGGKLMRFFSVEQNLGAGRVSSLASDSLVSVTTLDLHTFSQLSPFDGINMSKLFPNVENLNICFSFSKSLPNWVWTFTKLERFKLSGLCQNHDANDVDSFFTGISSGLCATLEKELTLGELETISTAKGFDRTMPFIGDCTNLKQLEMIFHTKLNFKFVTKVTAARAFKEVNKRTKIIFSLNASHMSVKETQEARQYLEPVAAYIEIEMLK